MIRIGTRVREVSTGREGVVDGWNANCNETVINWYNVKTDRIIGKDQYERFDGTLQSLVRVR